VEEDHGDILEGMCALGCESWMNRESVGQGVEIQGPALMAVKDLRELRT
jgi:hypothetical protein